MTTKTTTLTFWALVTGTLGIAIRRHRWRFIGTALATFACVATATAQPQQTYPNRPIRLVLPYAAGAGTDTTARLLAEKLADAFRQQVIVDNRPGAGGVVGTELVAKSIPDGYTLVMVGVSHTVLPSMHKKLPYDADKDFAPLSLLITYPYLIVVHPSVPAKSVKELIALAKAKPGQLHYASSGNGTISHLSGELFKSMTRTNLVHVPFKGIAPAIVGILAGDANLIFTSASSTFQQIKSGHLRALASTGEKRSSLLPDLPTAIEAGVPGYISTTWAGMLVPAGTPKSIVEKLNGEIKRVLQLPDIKEKFAANDFETVGSSPEEFGDFLKKEVAKWAKVLKESGAKAD